MDAHNNTTNICHFVLRDLIYKVERDLESGDNPLQIFWSDLQLPAYNIHEFIDHSPEHIIVEDQEVQVPTPPNETTVVEVKKTEKKKEIGEKFNQILQNTVKTLEKLNDLARQVENLEKIFLAGSYEKAVPETVGETSIHSADLGRAPLGIIKNISNEQNISNRHVETHFLLSQPNYSFLKREYPSDNEDNENKPFKKVKVRVGLGKRRSTRK